MLKLEISWQFFLCLFMVTLIYKNVLVITAFSCATNSYVHYLIKVLMICVTFIITIMCRKVTKKQAHQKYIKSRSNCVRSINLIQLYHDFVLITNLQSPLINCILKVKYVIICGTLKVIFICWIEEKQIHRSKFAKFQVTLLFKVCKVLCILQYQLITLVA